ncbi:MAG TPA: hypothetical protein VE242_12975 [Chthoniobacterales bacterium]|nr:hypothetical protein [Chthoniobacterales bacterium]
MKLSVMVLVLLALATNFNDAAADQPEATRPHFRQAKSYFCSSQAGLETFRAKDEEDIVAASRNWLQLTH